MCSITVQAFFGKKVRGVCLRGEGWGEGIRISLEEKQTDKQKMTIVRGIREEKEKEREKKKERKKAKRE